MLDLLGYQFSHCLDRSEIHVVISSLEGNEL